jgi:hypothetical protein
MLYCFFVPDSNNIHAPGVVGEVTLYTLPRGWQFCISEFCLRNEAKRGAVFWVISHQCSVSIDALVFPVLGRNKVAFGSSLHIADRRECCMHLSIFVSSYTWWQIEKPVNLVANAL